MSVFTGVARASVFTGVAIEGMGESRGTQECGKHGRQRRLTRGSEAQNSLRDSLSLKYTKIYTKGLRSAASEASIGGQVGRRR